MDKCKSKNTGIRALASIRERPFNFYGGYLKKIVRTSLCIKKNSRTDHKKKKKSQDPENERVGRLKEQEKQCKKGNQSISV